MELLDTFRTLRDSLVPIAGYASFGLKDRSLVVVSRAAGTAIQIVPNPDISLVTPQMVAYYARVQNISIELDTVQVSGISKLYSREQLTGSGVYYVVDGTASNNIVTGGAIYDRLPGVDLVDLPVCWNILLEARRS